MDGSRGRERRAPAQSEKRGSMRIVVLPLEQTKALLEVPLRLLLLLFVWGGFVGVVRVVPCGIVMERDEEKKRAKPMNGR